MKDKNIPCCYFPSMVLLVDDNQHFLEGITFKLDEKLAYQLYDKPYEALEFLKEKYQTRLTFEKWLLKNDAQKNESAHSFNIDIAAIHQELYSPRRFNEVSIVLIDYSMPSMNGLEFCQQIKTLPVKKILVTGEADHDIAVKAFNKGMIDQFVRKDAYDFADRINQIIFDFQKSYFQDFSKTLVDLLSAEENCPLADPAFVDFFEQTCNELAIVEYYLVEKPASFLLLDIDAKPTWLIVKNKNYLNKFSELIKKDEKYSFAIKKFGDNALIPFFGIDNDFKRMPVENWQDYLFPAKKLKGKETYYYSLIDNSKVNYIDPDKIVPYRGYLGL